jgi:hypothetical protein
MTGLMEHAQTNREVLGYIGEGDGGRYSAIRSGW